MFNELDMILPEGFDPAAGDANFTEDGELVDRAPAPTTEQQPEATPQSTEPTEPVTPTEPTTVQQEVTETQPVVPQTIRVRFNHEDRDLTFDEAAIYAQKGMNFDKVDQRAKDLEAKMGSYEDMAKMFGYENAEAMMKQARENYVDRKIQDLVDQGNSEAMARFLVNQEMKELQAKQAPAPETRELKSSLPQEVRDEIAEFNKAYPSVSKIPDEVFAMHKNGTRLKTAYEIYERQQTSQAALLKAQQEAEAAKSELAILRQNQAAAVKGPVSGTVGKASPQKDETEDPFLKGFNSAGY